MNKFLSNNIIFYGTAILLGSGIGIIVGLTRPNSNELPKEPESLEITETSIAEEREENKTKVVTEDSSGEKKSTQDKQESTGKTSTPTSVSSSAPATRQSSGSTQSKTTTNHVGNKDPWPEHVDANGNCLPASQQVDANGNFYPTCSSSIEGVKPDTDGSISYTAGDYDKSILGTCPSQRKNSSWETGSRLPAIGVISAGENKTSPLYSLNSSIESWWDSYKQGRWSGKHSMATLYNIEGFEKNYTNTLISFYINFSDLSVSWDNTWPDKAVQPDEAKRTKLNQMASDGTKYLRSLESRYNTKCPNN